eukprot:jgi/Chlat1/5349/Chrsp35S05279
MLLLLARRATAAAGGRLLPALQAQPLPQSLFAGSPLRVARNGQSFPAGQPRWLPVQAQSAMSGAVSSRPKKAEYPSTLYASAAIALIGALLFGYHLGVVNTALPYMARDLKFDEAVSGSLIVSSILVGSIAGAFGAGPVSESLGTKKALALNAIPYIVGTLMTAWATGLNAALIGRFVVGLAVGAASTMVPLYLADIAPTSLRGAFGSFNQLFVCVGILIAYLMGIPFDMGWSAQSTSQWWRFMFSIAAVPAAVMALGFLTIAPESPAWLSKAGLKEQASTARVKLLGEAAAAELNLSDKGAKATTTQYSQATTVSSPSTSGTMTSEEYQRLRAVNKYSKVMGQAAELEIKSKAPTVSASVNANPEPKAADVGWGELTSKKYRKLMVLALAMPVLQQISGINTVIYYSATVFARAGLYSPIVGSILVGVVNLAGTLIASSLMDKAGRKTLMLASFGGMAACLLALAVGLLVPALQPWSGPISLAAIFLYVISFAVGAGPIPWLFVAEILPNQLKSKVAALATTMNWVTNLIVGFTFPSMLAALDIGGSYGLYGVICLLAYGFLARNMIETKGRSSESIENELIAA